MFFSDQQTTIDREKLIKTMSSNKSNGKNRQYTPNMSFYSKNINVIFFLIIFKTITTIKNFNAKINRQTCSIDSLT